VSDLQRVVALGELLVARRKAMAEVEEELSILKADVLKIEREDMPNLMAEVGLQEIKLTNGSVITIKEDVDARISDVNRPAAYDWLLRNGYGGIIKTVVSVQFGKGEHDNAEAATRTLQNEFSDRPVALEETVHPMTLKAFVKERMTSGDPVPMDLFGVYAYSKAVIK